MGDWLADCGGGGGAREWKAEFGTEEGRGGVIGGVRQGMAMFVAGASGDVVLVVGSLYEERLWRKPPVGNCLDGGAHEESLRDIALSYLGEVEEQDEW